jgi:hypothetical protein
MNIQDAGNVLPKEVALGTNGVHSMFETLRINGGSIAGGQRRRGKSVKKQNKKNRKSKSRKNKRRTYKK